MNIYVGNLSYNLTEDELKQVFEPFGEVQSVKIIIDRQSGKPKGFGFVEMESENGNQAIEALNGNEIKGRKIQVNEAHERTEGDRPRRPFNNAGGNNRRFQRD